MIAKYMLFVILLILFLIALMMTKDYLSPSCLVCESFIFAYLSSIFCSRAGGWIFNLHWNTVAIISIGIFCFLVGSFFARAWKDTYHEEELKDITPLNINSRFVNIMLIIQVVLLLIFIYYFKKSGPQFSGMDWNSMMRMRRFIASYGEGLEIGIPVIVKQSVKLAKVNAFIALYYVMHNIAVSNVEKSYRLKRMKRLILVAILYFPFSILQSARFEIFTFIIGGIIIWYVFYRQYSDKLHIKTTNMLKAIRSLIIIVVSLLALMSILGTIVGREASNSLFSEAFNYMGRTIQAFDYFVQSYDGNFDEKLKGSETLFGIFKLLGQIGIIDEQNQYIHLEFLYVNNYSFGNTYTAFRRYLRDFGYIGIVLFPFLEGYILSSFYRKAKEIRYKELDMRLLCYSTVAYCLFFYAYDANFFSSVVSFNYIFLFVIMYIVSGIASDRITIGDGLKLKIKYKKRVRGRK